VPALDVALPPPVVEEQEPAPRTAGDVKKLGRIPDGGGWLVRGRAATVAHWHKPVPIGFDYVHTAVDDHSHYTYAEVLPDQTGASSAASLLRSAQAFAAAGIPTIDRVITDKAMNHRRSRAFRQAVAAVGARQEFIRPHCPGTNGKAERFNRTLAAEWAYSRPFASNAERMAFLQVCLEHYNLDRPHLGISDTRQSAASPTLRVCTAGRGVPARTAMPSRLEPVTPGSLPAKGWCTPYATCEGGGVEEAVIAFVGLVVTVATPTLTYLGVRRTTQVTVDAARVAATAAEAAAATAAGAVRDAAGVAAQASRDVAALTAQAAAANTRMGAESEFLTHFRWASELVASDNPRTRRVGIAVLESVTEDPELSPTHVAAAVGVVRSASASAVDRVGDCVEQAVAELWPAEDAEPTE
jgi:transposase InsO family protein